MFFEIDKLSRQPIYEQIVDRFREQIRTGLLVSGDRLPSVRELSVALGANPNTVQKAYLALDRMGLIASAPGRGSFVTEDAASVVRGQQLDRLSDFPALVRQFRDAGIPQEDLVSIIMEVYTGNPSEKGRQA